MEYLVSYSKEIVSMSSWAMLITGAITFVSCMFITAPYGRHNTAAAAQGWGPSVNPRLAWMLMECPNLIFSALFLWYRISFSSDNKFFNNDSFGVTNVVLLALFVLHYTNRSIVFPLKMNPSSSSRMPLSVMLLAMMYCSWNGFTQALALTFVLSFE